MSQAATTTIGTARTAVDDFVAAWNAHDPDAVRSVFTADGVLYDPATPDGLTGPAIAPRPSGRCSSGSPTSRVRARIRARGGRRAGGVRVAHDGDGRDPGRPENSGRAHRLRRVSH